MGRKALILVDFQKEWTDPTSDDFVGDISGVVERTNRLLDFCRSKDYKIIFTRHVEKDSTDAWSENSEGTQLIDTLARHASDVVITKYKVSPFFQTSLDQEIVGCEGVVVCGILTNMCVRSTVHDAYDRGLAVTVIKDCCVAFDNETQEFTFKDLKATREKVVFVNTNELVRSR